MEINVVGYWDLKNIPSASGIVKFGEEYFVIGDDSPFLFSLDRNFKLNPKIRLINSNQPSGERIAK